MIKFHFFLLRKLATQVFFLNHNSSAFLLAISWRTVLLGHILWFSKLTFFGSHLVRISTLVRFRYVPMLFLERSLYVPRTFQVRSRYVPGTFSTLNFVFFAKNVFFWRIYRSHSFPIGLLFQGVHSRWGGRYVGHVHFYYSSTLVRL